VGACHPRFDRSARGPGDAYKGIEEGTVMLGESHGERYRFNADERRNAPIESSTLPRSSSNNMKEIRSRNCCFS